MKQYEFRQHLQAVGLGLNAAARFFGMSDRRIARMISGAQEIPRGVIALLAVMVKYKITVEQVDALLKDEEE